MVIRKTLCDFCYAFSVGTKLHNLIRHTYIEEHEGSTNNSETAERTCYENIITPGHEISKIVLNCIRPVKAVHIAKRDKTQRYNYYGDALDVHMP